MYFTDYRMKAFFFSKISTFVSRTVAKCALYFVVWLIVWELKLLLVHHGCTPRFITMYTSLLLDYNKFAVYSTNIILLKFYDFEQLLLRYLFNHIYAICFDEIQHWKSPQNNNSSQRQRYFHLFNDRLLPLHFPVILPRVFSRCLNPFRCDFMRKFVSNRKKNKYRWYILYNGMPGALLKFGSFILFFLEISFQLQLLAYNRFHEYIYIYIWNGQMCTRI